MVGILWLLINQVFRSVAKGNGSKGIITFDIIYE